MSRAARLARDRGSATVLVLAIGLLTVLVGLASAAVGSAIVARHRAQSAADLGALAGAARTIDGAEAACARVAEIVARNGAEMTACTLDGADVVVTARASLGGVARFAGSASASARAGPVGADTSVAARQNLRREARRIQGGSSVSGSAGWRPSTSPAS